MQTIIMMADFGGYCFWEYIDHPEYKTGAAISLDSLTLSKETVGQLELWLEYFEECINVTTLKFNSDIETVNFDLVGKALWEQVQIELKGQYEVTYYSELAEQYVMA
jgi:hypothetical protein